MLSVCRTERGRQGLSYCYSDGVHMPSGAPSNHLSPQSSSQAVPVLPAAPAASPAWGAPVSRSKPARFARAARLPGPNLTQRQRRTISAWIARADGVARAAVPTEGFCAEQGLAPALRAVAADGPRGAASDAGSTRAEPSACVHTGAAALDSSSAQVKSVRRVPTNDAAAAAAAAATADDDHTATAAATAAHNPTEASSPRRHVPAVPTCSRRRRHRRRARGRSRKSPR